MAKVIYTGVSSKARKIKACYIGVSNKARKIKKGYIGVNNIARLCYSSGYMWARYTLASTGKVSLTKVVSNASGYRFAKDNLQSFYECVVTGNDSSGYTLKTSSTPEFNKRAKAVTTSGASSNSYYQVPKNCGVVTNTYYCVVTYGYEGGYNRLSGYDFYMDYNTDITTATWFSYLALWTAVNYNTNSDKLDIYRKNTIQTKGSFIDYVTSDNSNAYPTNGISGSYWYVKQ